MTPLRTNYTDATWTGDKKYRLINNSDGTVSLQDVTVYTNKANSFFGASDANAMNEAINSLANGYILLEEKTATVGAINAGKYYTDTSNISITKTGYTPIGVTQFQINGTNASDCSPTLWKIHDDKLWLRIRNNGTANATSVTVDFTVLYVKNL